MAQYVARVELHSGSERDYLALHANMSRVGWGRTIALSDGTNRWLPTGLYLKVTNEDLGTVTSQAEAAANATGKENELFVALTNGTVSLRLALAR